MTWKNYLPMSTVVVFFLLLAARDRGWFMDCGHPFVEGEVSMKALCENLNECKLHAADWDNSVVYLFAPNVDWEFENGPGPELQGNADGVSLWIFGWSPVVIQGEISHPGDNGEVVSHDFGAIFDADVLNLIMSQKNCWTAE